MEVLEAIGLFVCILALFALVILLFIFLLGFDTEDGIVIGSVVLLFIIAFLFSIIYVKFINCPEEFGYMKIVEESIDGKENKT